MNEGMQKSRKLQIKTANSFNRVRKSKCSTVPQSPFLQLSFKSIQYYCDANVI